MADKTEKQHDLGVLEEDDEFEEFPAEDWKVRDRNMILNLMFFVKKGKEKISNEYQNFHNFFDQNL